MMACEYCNDGKPHSFGENFSDIGCELVYRIEVNDDCGLLIPRNTFDGDEFPPLKISHCPKCGEKLGDTDE